MNVIDYAILIVVGISALIGVMRGLVGEVMSMLVWIAAFVLSFLFGDSAASLFSSIDTAAFRMMLGYAGVFGGTLIAGSLLTWLLRTLIHSSGLSGTDRLAGLGFGVVRGVAIVAGIVLLLGFTSLPSNSTWQQSALMPSMERGAIWLKGFLPTAAAAENRLGQALASIKQAIPNLSSKLASGASFASLPSLQSITSHTVNNPSGLATSSSGVKLPSLSIENFSSLSDLLSKTQPAGRGDANFDVDALLQPSQSMPSPASDGEPTGIGQANSDHANIDASPRRDTSYIFPPES